MNETEIIAEVEAVAARCDVIETQCASGTMPFRRWGSAGREIVVLAHGGSGSWTHWIRNIEAFLARLMIHDRSKIDDLAVWLQTSNTDRARFKSPQFARSSLVLDGVKAATAPLYVIYGEFDAPAFPNFETHEARLREVRPDVKFEIIPGAGIGCSMSVRISSTSGVLPGLRRTKTGFFVRIGIPMVFVWVFYLEFEVLRLR